LSRPDLGFLKAKDGEPVFREPWQAQTLALADLVVKRDIISAAQWADTLGAEIKALNAEPDDRETYYRAALAALERVLMESGATRTRNWTSASTNGSAPICAPRTENRSNLPPAWRQSSALPCAPKS
jgi:hypothetical protein